MSPIRMGQFARSSSKKLEASEVTTRDRWGEVRFVPKKRTLIPPQATLRQAAEPVACSAMSDLLQSFPLRRGRVHEACGPGAVAFAAMVACEVVGDLLWVRENWQTDAPVPVGLAGFLEPSRLLMAQVAKQSEGLAVAEEALRDGAVPLVVIEISAPLNLTEGRRLQLAAAAGNSTGLCLIPGGMGSNAAETRWQCDPVFDAAAPDGDSTLQCWSLIKNKSGTLGTWHVRWDWTSRRLHVVSPVGQRPGSEGAPG